MNAKQWGVMLGMIVLSLLIACSGHNDMTNREPPSLMIHVRDTDFEAALGTYSWSYITEDGSESGLEDDRVAPPELVANQRVVKVTTDAEVELDFERDPNQYKVNIWGQDDSILSSSDDIDLSGHGEVIYEVVARFEQGTVSYAFALEIE